MRFAGTVKQKLGFSVFIIFTNPFGLGIGTNIVSIDNYNGKFIDVTTPNDANAGITDRNLSPGVIFNEVSAYCIVSRVEL